MNKIESHIHEWLHENHLKTYADKLIADYYRFSEVGLADNSFETEFTSGSEAKRSQRIWEVELACFLMDHGYELESEDFGPDLKATIGDQTVWFEAVSPEPEGIPEEFLNPAQGTNNFFVGDYPANEILLRVQWGIYQKYKKLITYLKKGIVDPIDGYIIAIDLSQLMAFSVGISGQPIALEVY